MSGSLRTTYCDLYYNPHGFSHCSGLQMCDARAKGVDIRKLLPICHRVCGGVCITVFAPVYFARAVGCCWLYNIGRIEHLCEKV